MCYDNGKINIMRYKNVEFRHSNESRHAEIIAWIYNEDMDKETGITLCWIKEGNEGYYMKTVGDRYVEYEDMEALSHVAKYAMRSMNVQFEFEDNQYEH